MTTARSIGYDHDAEAAAARQRAFDYARRHVPYPYKPGGTVAGAQDKRQAHNKDTQAGRVACECGVRHKKARPPKSPTSSTIRRYVAAAQRTSKVVHILSLHDKGWLMKAIVAEAKTTYKTADKILTEAGRVPNYSNVRKGDA